MSRVSPAVRADGHDVGVWMEQERKKARKGEVRPISFSLIVIGVCLTLLVIPFPEWLFLKQVARARTASAPIAIVGASTIDTVSACDADQRNIADMLSAVSGRSVSDLSVGGQLIADSINLAAVAGRNPTVQDVILPVAFPYVDDWTTPYFRKLPVYKVAAPEFAVFAAPDLSSLLAGLTGRPRRIEGGYRFEGKDYPDYRQLAKTVFADAKAQDSCPERLLADPAFTRSYYWWTYVATAANPGLSTLVPDLSRDLRSRGKHLVVVMLPVNLSFIAELDSNWPAIIRKTQRDIVGPLREQGVDVVDLSDAVPSDEFTQRSVGTVHFNAEGRMRIVQAIVASL